MQINAETQINKMPMIKFERTLFGLKFLFQPDLGGLSCSCCSHLKGLLKRCTYTLELD